MKTTIFQNNIKAMMSTLSVVFILLVTTINMQACPGCLHVKKNTLPKLSNSASLILDFSPESISIPLTGGEVTFNITSFYACICPICNLYTFDRFTCICYRVGYGYPAIAVDLSSLYNMMEITCGNIPISYTVNTNNSTMTVHCPATLPISGVLTFSFKNFSFPMPSKTCNFIKSSPLIPGSISLSGNNTIPYGIMPGNIMNTQSADGGNGIYAYQWQRKIIATGVESDITGATSVSYQPAIFSESSAFRRKVTSGDSIAYTNWVVINITESPLQAGHITCSGTIPVISGTTPGLLRLQSISGGLGNYQFQWQQKIKSTGIESEITGATANTYQPPPLSETVLFRCRVQSGTQTAYSDWFAITVGKGPTALNYYPTTQGLNYIVTCAPLEAVQHVGELPKTKQQRASSVTYYDGLGRPIQTVLPLHTPEGKDLVSRIEYDAVGRESKKYLPVPVAGGSSAGAYVAPSSLQTKADEFYGSNSCAFAETRYEPSPLNRVTEQVMPGAAWAAHPLQTDYQTNASAIGSWRVTDNAGTYTAITYPAASLYVTQQKDADGRAVREYKDKLGQLVMTEMNDGSQWLQTRYVYDDLGLQRAVVPPEATSINQEEYCYYYRYDQRRRVVEKKLPGAAWQYFVYDKRDRLVFSQDGNQRNRYAWTCFTYDALNRETGRAETHSNGANAYSRETLQNKVDNNDLLLFYPDVFLSLTYYDNYPYLPDRLHFAPNELVSIHAASNKGRVTMKETGTLGDAVIPPPLPPGERAPYPTEEIILTSVFYYDDYGRVVQSVATNHLGGTDRISTQYDFRGNVLQTLQESWWTNTDDEPGIITLLTTFEYDALKRPTAVKLKINNGTEVTVSQTEYDELLRVKKKILHGGQEVIDYEYNIQNWLTKINSPLFTEKLHYEQPLGNVAPQYNGNISGMNWRTNLQGNRYYIFTYDGVNRLRSSQYAIGTGTFKNLYSEKFFYDKNGNIRSIQRYGAEAIIDNLSCFVYGNQRISVMETYGEPVGFPPGTYGYTYDLNGNMTHDEQADISYNLLNLPQWIHLSGGRKIKHMYAADGRKLASVAMENNAPLSAGTKTYNGNLVFDINGDLDYIIFPEGRILPNGGSFTYEYHLKDHLGSVRVAFTPTGSEKIVVQENTYYPSGAPIADMSWNASLNTNRYKHTGMETIEDFSLGYIDNSARWRLNNTAPMFMGIDPMAERTPWISPYAYCNNNPVRFIDPDGMDWYSYQETYYINEDGEERTRTRYQYTTEYRSQEELNKAGIEGTYLGKTHFSAGTYYGLEGGTTSDFTAMISAITEDFGKMNSSDAKVHKSKAEAYFSQVRWNEDLPTSFAAFDNIYVVSNSMNSYVSLTDKSLKREFDQEYRQHLNKAQNHFYGSPVTDNRVFAILARDQFPLSIILTTEEVIDWSTRMHYNKLLKYYKQYNIIK